MKRSELESWIHPTPFIEKGVSGKKVVSYEAKCEWDDCSHINSSTVHYGDEKEAEKSVISKMILHYCKEHGVELDD